MASIPEDISYTDGDITKLSPSGFYVLVVQHFKLFVATINAILDYLRNMSAPEAEVSQSDVISAIQSMRKVRLIDFAQVDGTTVEYSDGHTITRSGLMFVISHPYSTTTQFVSVRQIDGTLVQSADVRCVSDQVIVDFMTQPDENLNVLIG